MLGIRPPLVYGLLVLVLVSICNVVAADASGDKPFARKHVVLQVSDSDPDKQLLVLNVVANLLKHYGTDSVDVEVVAFSGGLPLLLADNTNADRIAGLEQEYGVRFTACENTYAVLKHRLGYAPQLNPHVTQLAPGVARMIDLVDQGYVVVQP